MIKPDQIPEFTGDLAQLDLDYAGLKTDAGNVRGTGADIDSQFQGLTAFYKAPEAEQLFATTKPVKDRADTFGTHLETVSGALSSYATEIRPLVSKLADLKVQAQTFVNSVKDDDDWEYDGDKVDEHNRLRDQITETVAAFWAAERTCHNKITGIWGGTQMVAGDGSDRKDQYGYSAADLKNAQLPWGDPVEERHHWYEVGHWVKSFVWDGLIVDGIWGTIKGLGTLVGFGGWDAMGQAWKGLAQLATGLALSSLPVVGTAFWLVPDDKLPSWIRDSRTAMKETGKALVAWDEWGKNPGRAAGAVTFNVLTTVFTGGAGGAAAGAGKAGAVAKALSIAGKAGKIIDPMTYISKAAGAGLSKVGDITAALKGVGKIEIPKLPDTAVILPDGAKMLPNGTIHLPEGSVVPSGLHELPDGGFKAPDDVPVLHEGTTRVSAEGDPTIYMSPDGKILDAQGKVLLDTAERGPGDAVPAHTPDTPTPLPDRQPAMAGAATHTPVQSVHLGSSLDDVGRVPEGAPTGVVHAGGDGLTVHAGGHTPEIHAHAPDGHVPDGHTPGSHTPGGTADHLPANTADHPPTGHTGDHTPGGGTHDGPSPSHETPSSGHTHGSHDGQAPVHEGGPSDAGHVPPGGGHTDGPGSDLPGGDRPIDEIPPDRYSTGEHVSHPASEPMRPDQEPALMDALKREKLDAADQEKILRTLKKEPFGADVAELISRGHLSGTKGYDEILKMCKQASKKVGGDIHKGMVPAAYMALSHATELQSRGFKDLAFELKDDATGLDLDVTTLHPDGMPHHGYQLKDVDNIAGIRGAAKSAGKQLLPDLEGANKVAILDVHQPLSELNAKVFKAVEFEARKSGATFHLRFQDGSVTVPANGQPLYP